MLILLALVVILLAGCGPGVEDYSIKLPGDYQLVRANPLDITVSPTDETLATPATSIPAKVVKIAWNGRYVIAEQQELKPRDPTDPYGQRDPINVFHYWIVDTKSRTAHGPYDQPTFARKKMEFSIPDSLELKDPDSYPKIYS